MTSPRLLVPFGSGVVFGSERGNIEALTALKREGCEVLCLVRPEPWAAEVRDAIAAAGLDSVIVPYIYEWRPKYALNFILHNTIAFPLANISFLRIAAQFRPTHIYAFNAFWLLNFVVALNLLRTPLVYRAGDEPSLHNAIFRWLWSFVARRTQHFVANSEFIKGRLIASGVDAGRITIIYNKPPTRFRRDTTVQFPEVQRAGGFNILYVGQIIPTKGVHVLLDAFRSLAPSFPEASLLIAGPITDWEGHAWARDLLQSVADDPQITHRVSFLGYVEDTPALYAASHVHVCPTLSEEPLANVVMEAKQEGVPSIVFRSGGLPEMVSSGIDGFVCPDKTAESLAEALSAYLQNPQLAIDHGKAARGSLANFQIDAFSRRWRNVIDGAVQEDAATPALQHG